MAVALVAPRGFVHIAHLFLFAWFSAKVQMRQVQRPRPRPRPRPLPLPLPRPRAMAASARKLSACAAANSCAGDVWRNAEH